MICLTLWWRGGVCRVFGASESLRGLGSAKGSDAVAGVSAGAFARVDGAEVEVVWWVVGVLGVAAAAVGVGKIAGARGKAGTIAWMTEGGGGMHFMLGMPLAARFAV